MAGYAAELQTQIAEKEQRKRLQRQESLRQSQNLLAQRMTVPSGLVSLLSLSKSDTNFADVSSIDSTFGSFADAASCYVVPC